MSIAPATEFGLRYVEAARAYVGTAFTHGGRSNLGVDCAGLIICAARDVGLAVEDALTPDGTGPGYARSEAAPLLLAALQKHGEKVPLEELQLGDVLLLRYEKQAQHLAIVTERDTVIQACQTGPPGRRSGREGRVIESRLASVLPKLVAVYRWRQP